ncbi:hypothetical protein JW964_18475 [candidate division KSB1 bacterium]|nr:hypothetical protein [candidate division KSB1 bacterium]
MKLSASHNNILDVKRQFRHSHAGAWERGAPRRTTTSFPRSGVGMHISSLRD